MNTDLISAIIVTVMIILSVAGLIAGLCEKIWLMAACIAPVVLAATIAMLCGIVELWTRALS